MKSKKIFFRTSQKLFTKRALHITHIQKSEHSIAIHSVSMAGYVPYRLISGVPDSPVGIQARSPECPLPSPSERTYNRWSPGYVSLGSYRQLASLVVK